MPKPLKIILASTSSARKKLLERIQLNFAIAAPDIDETPFANENVVDLVKRLAETKARKVAAHYPRALIIGSDQAVEFQGQIFGKPGDHAAAVKQLQLFSGQAVNFMTGLCLLNTTTNQARVVIEPFTVIFRQLKLATIEKYLELEKPYYCAGSCKAEGLGIALSERFIGGDPTALEGLPLIQLVNLLEKENFSIL